MLPISGQNIVGSKILAVTDLGLASSLPNATPQDSSAFSTGAPGTVLVLGQLSSGTMTIGIRVDETAADAVANLGTPTATLSLSGTTKGFQTVDTTADYGANTSDLYVALRQTGAAGGSILTLLVVLALYELRGGEDWYSIKDAGFMAVAGTSAIDETPTNTEPLGYQDGEGNLYLTSF